MISSGKMKPNYAISKRITLMAPAGARLDLIRFRVKPGVAPSAA